jgi:hypothetical protein
MEAVMIKMIMIFIFLFLPLQGCYSQNQANTASEAQTNDQYVWDFGQVRAGDIAKHTFIFKNETNEILTIKNVSTSCGCTASEVKKKVLQPGESTEIEVRFNSKKYSGPVKQYVYVNTDDPVSPVVKFTIKADVIK